VRPPFSMKALRDAHRRVVAGREGWRGRRRTSNPVFPFRRNPPEAEPEPPPSRDLGGMVGCAILIVVGVGLIALIVWVLSQH
jgi:hypothetical protein